MNKTDTQISLANLSSCTKRVKEVTYIYKVLVRPHVEYGHPVWDPHLKRQIKLIEIVQRRAAYFIKTVIHGNQEQLLTSHMIELDTTEGTKNNLAVNRIPQSNSR